MGHVRPSFERARRELALDFVVGQVLDRIDEAGRAASGFRARRSQPSADAVAIRAARRSRWSVSASSVG